MFDQLSRHQSPPRDPPPRFSRVTTLNDLNPQTNSQPAFRRANPEGGFISVCPRVFVWYEAVLRDPDVLGEIALASLDKLPSRDIPDMQPKL